MSKCRENGGCVFFLQQKEARNGGEMEDDLDAVTGLEGLEALLGDRELCKYVKVSVVEGDGVTFTMKYTPVLYSKKTPETET